MGSLTRYSNAEKFVQAFDLEIRALIIKQWGPDRVSIIEFVEWPMTDGKAVKITIQGSIFTLPLVEGDDDSRGYWQLIDIKPTKEMEKWLDNTDY